MSDTDTFKMKIYALVGYLENIENEKQSIKSLTEEIVSTFNVKKRDVSRLAKIAHKNKVNETMEEISQFEELVTKFIN